MPKFKIDNREIEFEPGDTIMRAIYRHGIDIPHYCWHPGLSVAANCRMCLVEVLPPPGRRGPMMDVLGWDSEAETYLLEKKPKLVPSCQQVVSEGMEVLSESSPHVERARSAVQEFLLLNHPVDCPTCDQAGECRLQDYWLEHQHAKKRMTDEILHMPKAQVFGPTIVYDAERCVLCTRCIRVCEEVAKDPVLSKRERGNLSEIVLAPGRQLDHAYTLMTEYVCPVGALTSQDFRFKARVWFLRSARTVCVGCATGCTAFADFDPRNQRVYRYRPRENLAENKYWMCDEGMLDYHRIHEHRLLEARVRGEHAERSLAMAEAARALMGVDPDRLAVVLGIQHSNEDNFALLTLARDFIGAGNFFIAGRPAGEGDDILRDPDKNPNRAGVVALATTTPPGSFEELLAALEQGEVTHVLALGSDLPDATAGKTLERARAIVVLGTHTSGFVEHATVALPASSWAECDGTFVNVKGVAQESERVIRPVGDSLPAWALVGELGRAMGFAVEYKKLREVREAMAPAPGAAVVGSRHLTISE
ncbi:MAG: 2Fe-2S iron-sulfur cluster-binding protein [Sorangiineae bacterium]|nr:2Fe-2S iron-sulfur cluster-binding protein [Polyangiaceae bacterium]MEB2322106.1 2Fe-2S iron-sulfur cluster-binding protein [Sorangiineae bacterium]